MTIPLVLLPGLMCDARQWSPVVDRLPGQTCQIAALTEDSSVDAMAERILSEAPPRFALAGFSMGGIVALEVQRRAPDRVAGLALICANARPDAQTRRAEQVFKANQGLLAEVIGDVANRYFAADPNGALRELVIDMAMTRGPAVFARQNAALSNRIDSRPLLPRITAPSLIVNGDVDAISPPELSQEMADAIPHSRLVTLAGCGHMAPIEQPTALAAALAEWLATIT